MCTLYTCTCLGQLHCVGMSQHSQPTLRHITPWSPWRTAQHEPTCAQLIVLTRQVGTETTDPHLGQESINART